MFHMQFKMLNKTGLVSHGYPTDSSTQPNCMAVPYNIENNRWCVLSWIWEEEPNLKEVEPRAWSANRQVASTDQATLKDPDS